MNNPATVRHAFSMFGVIVAVLSSLIVSGANIILLAWGFQHFYPTLPEPWAVLFLIYAGALGGTPYWLTLKLYLRAFDKAPRSA